MPKSVFLSAACVLLLSLISCEKVIEPDLGEMEPQLVIEGTFASDSDTCFVLVTRSTGFYAPSDFEVLDDALVVLSDNQGNASLLSYTGSGRYYTDAIDPVHGNVYTITVTVDGKQYVASSQMPFPVELDTAVEMAQVANGNTRRFIVPVYDDPAGIRNYYRFKLYVNHHPVDKILTRKDDLTDGITVTRPLGPFFNEMTPGDTVLVEMQSIDKSVHTYFSGLEEAMSNNTAAPSNPISNFSGGCLGYFSACSVSKKSVIVTQ